MKVATILLAAGQGTRMKSELPKVLHPLCGQPMIQYPLDRAVELSSAQVLLVLGHQADRVQQHMRTFLDQHHIQVVLQTEQRGTGHAVRQALPALAADITHVLVLYGDTPLLQTQRLQQLVTAGHTQPVALFTTRPPHPAGYGRILRSATTGEVERIVEDRDCSSDERNIREVNAGIYVMERSFVDASIATLQSRNAQNELYLTDLVAQAASRGRVYALEVPFDEVQGVNDRVELARAERCLRTRINESHQRQGVTLRDPETTYIDGQVRIGPDTEIGPGVCLRGTTSIGHSCRVDTGVILENTLVQDGVVLKAYTVATEAQIGPQAQVGPFAHLRPGTRLDGQVRIGNFVELKNTHVGAGSKANHLSYLGDAQIGKEVNVGCGTITCNYDGYQKHQTLIEDGAFIGSDTQLVAPVRIGKEAVVGAGTTVTTDVPAGALALSRVPQTHRMGYREQKKAAWAQRNLHPVSAPASLAEPRAQSSEKPQS